MSTMNSTVAPGSADILLVEDDSIVAMAMQHSLSKLGYTVHDIVTSGEEAISAVAKHQPAIILMDIFLDGHIDGIETAETILRQAQIPIIFLTGHDDEETLNRAMITETFGYIIKPAKPRDLHVAIEIALYKHAAQQALTKSEQKYRLLFDSMLNGFALHEVVFNAEGQPVDLRFLDVNPAYAAFFSKPEEEIVGHTLRELAAKTEPFWIDIFAKTALMQKSTRFDAHAGYLGRYFSVVAFSPQRGQVAAIFEDTTKRKEAEKNLQHRTFHDQLTNLPNRVLCLDRIKQSMERAHIRDDYLFAVALVDVDRFKDINDTLGHHVGDYLLQTIAQILLQSVTSIDTVARLGDDEFVILLEELSTRETGESRLLELKNTLNRTLEIDGHSVHISASFGTIFGPVECSSPEHYLQGANIALRYAQENGPDQLCSYAEEMQNRAIKKLDTETRLRNAISDNEFALALQPVYAIGPEEPVLSGFEALLRWKPRDRDWVPPGEFIPIAEQTGLILPIGNWVMHQACMILQQWSSKFPDNNLGISINLSARQFGHAQLVPELFDCLSFYNVNPSRLRLEITESDVMTNPEMTVEQLNRIKDLGMVILVDDFGTGYSSMSYLQRFPIDTLKIDRSFVIQLDQRANQVIVRTIINLAHSLGLDVVAEGIETEKQYLILKGMGCQYAQGYHFSRPVFLDEAEALVQQHCARRTPAE